MTNWKEAYSKGKLKHRNLAKCPLFSACDVSMELTTTKIMHKENSNLKYLTVLSHEIPILRKETYVYFRITEVFHLLLYCISLYHGIAAAIKHYLAADHTKLPVHDEQNLSIIQDK